MNANELRNFLNGTQEKALSDEEFELILEEIGKDKNGVIGRNNLAILIGKVSGFIKLDQKQEQSREKPKPAQVKENQTPTQARDKPILKQTRDYDK